MLPFDSIQADVLKFANLFVVLGIRKNYQSSGRDLLL